MSRSIWATLGLSPTNDEREIRRAYARQLKIVHPEDDPTGFQTLREAHDEAMRLAKNGWAVPRNSPATLTPMDGIVTGDRREIEDDWDGYDEGDHHHAGWDDGAPRDWSRRDDQTSGGWRDDDARDWSPQAAETRGRWKDGQPRDWTDQPRDSSSDWDDGPDPVLRAELEKEREQARRHAELCDTLLDYLNGPSVEPTLALEKLLAVLRSPAMDSIQTHDRTERWLAHVLAHGGVGSETLIEPAIHFFGWQATRIGVDLSHAQGVLHRREALKALQALQKPGSPSYQAFTALRRRPDFLDRFIQRLTPGLAPRIRDLLERMQWEFPQLQSALDPAAVAWWREHLSRPRLAPLFLLALVALPPLVGLFWAVNGDWGPFDWRVAGAIAIATTAALFAAGMGYLHGVAAPSRRWINGDPWSRPLWLRYGWAPAALMLPPLGWLLPAGPVGVTVVTIAALGLAAWTRVTISHLSRRQGPPNVWLHAGLVCGFMVMTLTLDAYWPHAGLGLLAWSGAALVFTLGAPALNEEWTYLPPSRQTLGAVGLLAAAFGLAPLLFIAPAWDVLGVNALGPVMGLVGALFLAERALAWERAHPLLTARRILLMIGWAPASILAVALPLGEAVRLSVAQSLWLLAAAVLTALSILHDGLRRPRAKKRA